MCKICLVIYFPSQVENTLGTFVSLALGQPVLIEKSNLTTLVTGVKNMLSYMQDESRKKPDWNVFHASEQWKQVFIDNRLQSRIDV